MNLSCLSSFFFVLKIRLVAKKKKEITTFLNYYYYPYSSVMFMQSVTLYEMQRIIVLFVLNNHTATLRTYKSQQYIHFFRNRIIVGSIFLPRVIMRGGNPLGYKYVYILTHRLFYLFSTMNLFVFEGAIC